MKYFTLTGCIIPESNILKTYKKGTCDYQHTQKCTRCFGRGIYGNHGVCWKCNGQGKVLVKSKGYSQHQLSKTQQEKNVSQQPVRCKEEQNKLERRIKIIYSLITKGGKNSDFATNIASLTVKSLDGGKSLSEKQLHWAIKLIENNDYDMKEQCIKWLTNKHNTI